MIEKCRGCVDYRYCINGAYCTKLEEYIEHNKSDKPLCETE
jgi:hypothetical protein